MRTPNQKRIPINVSLPPDFYLHLEDIWRDRWNRGYTALRFREFVAELVAAGFQAWQERNPPTGLEVEEPEPLGGEWDF
jgi:hypothetical protein